MNKEKYLEMRNGLYNEAENLINEGKIEEAQGKMKEITDLDNKFENEATAMANLNALKDNAKVTDINNLGTNGVKGTVVDSIDDTAKDDYTNTMEYRKAFMNYVVKGAVIPGELKNQNSNTKTTDVGEVIPETILSKIVE